GNQARIPLQLAPTESAVVCFTRRPDPLRVVETNLDDVTRVEDDGESIRVEGWSAAGGRVRATAVRMFDSFAGEANVVPPPPAVELRGAWEERFAPETPAAGLRLCRIRFDLPPAAEEDDLDWSLSLEAAPHPVRATLNGRDLGERHWPPCRWQELPGLR